MKITEVRFQPFSREGSNMRSFVEIVLEGCLSIHDLKILVKDGEEFVSWPSKKLPNGEYRDVVHPITKEARAGIQERILTEWRNRNVSGAVPGAEW